MGMCWYYKPQPEEPKVAPKVEAPKVEIPKEEPVKSAFKKSKR